MKKIFLLAGILFLFGFAGVASACIGYPIIQAKNNETCRNIYFEENYRNETAVLETLNLKAEVCNFTNSDIAIIKDYVLNGYSVREQTSEEYNLFLEEAKQANSVRPDCSDYIALDHKERWTGIIKSGDDYINGECVTYQCVSALANILWNDLRQEEGCKNLYWFDSTNKECGQKEFCGLYMYQGLQTFETSEACQNALNGQKPVAGSKFNLRNIVLFIIGIALIILGIKIGKWFLWAFGALAVVILFLYLFVW